MRATPISACAGGFLIGSMWWQQTLGSCRSPIQLQADFVNNTVLPHFYVFAPIVYSLEVLTAVSLILGIFVRFWGFIGAPQILNLWLGLYNAEREWPWTYFFLLLLQLTFALHQYGRSLGLDAIIVNRKARGTGRHAVSDVVLDALT